jgi:23S rRNA (guanosine2251-2'-O)-methyltransferase
MLVVGRIPVWECLKSKKRPARTLYYFEGARGLEEILSATTAPTVACDRDTLDAMTEGAVHQGVALVADPLPLLTMRDWNARKATPDSVILLIDGVEDPQNFGAMVRSAAALGVGAVVFGKDRAAPISPASVKAAAGAMEWVDLVQETNLVRALEVLKEHSFWSYALTAECEQDIWTADLRGRVAMVVGSEGEGIRRLLLERCDFKVRIPLQGAITSLNASVSVGIALAECARQRQ